MNRKKFYIAISFISFLIVPLLAVSQSIENSYTVNEEVPIGGSAAFYVPVSNVPAGVVITNVQAKFEYIAYNGVQNYVSCRFNKGTDPGAFGGVVLVAQGNLPSGNPGTYGYISFSNWNGQTTPNTNYYFRFSVAAGSPFTCTVKKIYVRITYSIPTITVTSPNGGETWYKGNNYTITWNSSNVTGNVQIDLYKGNTMVQQVAAAATNNGAHSFTPQSSLTNGSNYKIGISAMGGTVSGFSTNHFTITNYPVNPQVSVSPSSGTNGTTFQQPGSGFTPNGTATLHFNTPDGPSTVSNKPINSSGSYTHSWTCEGCPNGSYSYYAVDNSSGITSNTVYFTVFTANPQVSVSPSSGTNGTTFQQPGSGFTPNGTATLHFNTPDGPTTVSNKPINSSGSYTHSWTCEGCPNGSYSYYAVDNSSGITSNTVYFTVFTANPQVSVSPSSGTNGTTFQQPGSGFTPNGTATLHFNTPDGPTTVSNKPINSSGSYTHSWTCEGCPNGSYSITQWTIRVE
jgi:hypothetical protein